MALKIVKSGTPGGDYKRPPGVRAGLTRTKIALAAAKLLEQGGPETLSRRELAKSLGVFPTTISAHFQGGLEDLENEIIRAILENVAPPYGPEQDPKAYLLSVFLSVLEKLKGRPVIAMLTVRRFISEPLVIPTLAERSLASLAALAPEDVALSYRMMLEALFALILSGPARTSNDHQAKPFRVSAALSESEFPYITKFKDAISADIAKAVSWSPDPKEAKVAIDKLITSITK